MTKRWENPAEKNAFYLSKKVFAAIRDHNMVDEGDRILIGLSGGKDSLALMYLLGYMRRYSEVPYEVVLCHVAADAKGEIKVSPAIRKIMEESGLPYIIKEIDTTGEELPLTCARCARLRRKALFEAAKEAGCGKLALGHRLEDFAATALMNLFSSGRLETMAYRREYFGGELTVIRPIAYLRETDVKTMTAAAGLEPVPSECPLAGQTARSESEDILAAARKAFRGAAYNIVHASDVINE